MHPLILAALIGGGTGGLSAKARGTDVMKGILTGAASGAVTSGLGSMLSAGQAAAGQAAAGQTAEALAKEQIKKELASKAMTPAQFAAKYPGVNPTTQAYSYAKNYGLGQMDKVAGTSPTSFQQAMDPFGLAAKENVGRLAYATTPSAAMTGEFLFNPPEKAKKKGPPLNMLYGRNPGRFMFGEWADPSKVEEIYTDKENPYYYPEYAEGGPVEEGMNMNAIAQYAAEYLQGQGVEPTIENVQEVVEKVLAQQAQQQYQPMTGLGGQLQRMTQQYAQPMGEEVVQETESVQRMNQGGMPDSEEDSFKNYFGKGMGLFSKKGRDFFTDKSQGLIPMLMRGNMNQGGTPRRYYQEGGLGALMGDMTPSGDLDMRPGGESVGPGTGTSDDIPAMLSDGEFVMTAAAVEGAGGGDRDLGSERMMNMMKNFEQGGQPSQESQGLGSMEETTMTEMIGPQGMMMEEDTMMEGVI